MAVLDTVKKALGKRYLSSGLMALGGMVVGAVVGIGVQAGVESTGLLGPSVDALIAEQEINFDEVHARLDRLRDSTDDPDLRRELSELTSLIQYQDELRQRAGDELSYLSEQVVTLKDQALADSSVMGGADFWLKNGEGINIGRGNQVFGLVFGGGHYADVNLSGKKQRLAIGDQIGFEDEELKCAVFVKQLNARPDGRIGFDVDCS